MSSLRQRSLDSTELSQAVRVREAIRLELARRTEERRAQADKVAEDQRRNQELLDNLEGVRERCQKFSGFVREAWHVPEPTTKYLHNWHIDAIGEHLEAVHAGEIRRLVINMPPGMMKLLADSTPVLTPDGYRTHGDLKIGDRVFGPDGLPTKILNVSPDAPADYEVTFSTGETVKCNGAHLWTVYDRHAFKWKTVTTEYLLGANKQVGRNRFLLPEVRPLQFEEKADLPFHPYFLGCWLGDGRATNPDLTHHVDDNDHIRKLEGLGYHVTNVCVAGENTLRSAFTYQGLREKLRDVGLFDNKHIPEEYLLSSEEQRLELLAGLIDTDGCLSPERGRFSLTTTDEKLADGYRKLLNSLLIRFSESVSDVANYGPYVSTKQSYLFAFNVDRKVPTAVKRKQTDRFDALKRKRAIVEIKRSDAPENGHCITVDRKDGLYVVGNTMIPTHNSTTVSVMFPAWEWGAKNRPGLRYFTTSYEATFATRDSRKQRDLVLSDWYKTLWPHVQLTNYDESWFHNTYRGYRHAVPITRLTAGRGDRLIIDDPHSTEQAESEAKKDTQTRIFKESAQSRLNTPAVDPIILMMHRLATDDLTGVIEDIEAAGGEQYVHLVLPMEYVRSTSLETRWFKDPRTREGELLFPERLGAAEAAKLKVTSDYAWDTQYQQRARKREGYSYFSESHLLEAIKDATGKVVSHRPVDMPRVCDTVFAVVDSATKVQKKNDGTGVMYLAVEATTGQPRAWVLDWDIQQMQADVLTAWLPNVVRRCEELARQCRARGGSGGVVIEDKDSGQALLQHAAKMRWPARAIPSDLTAMGKDARAVSCSGYVYEGRTKFTREAWEKTVVYKGRSANHAVRQITEYRRGFGTPSDEDELFDCWCYSNQLMFGDYEGK